MFTLNCNGKIVVLDKPVVMGIMNITPDSFYEGSRFENPSDILRQAEKMLGEGAAILDIGGQSTRPNAVQLTADEEMERVIPAIESIHYNFPEAIISVDTFHSRVAMEAVNAGAGIINDIGGGTMDKDMLATAGQLKVPYICMHIKGTPSTMQQQAAYENVTEEVANYFIEKIDLCKKQGIQDIIIDPGFGFAKTIEHNFQLLSELSTFKILEKPILLGISRKSTIYKTLNTTAAETLNGTTSLHMAGLINGATILRAHDVKEAVEVIKLFSHLTAGRL